jgi:hypothetical protein
MDTTNDGTLAASSKPHDWLSLAGVLILLPALVYVLLLLSGQFGGVYEIIGKIIMPFIVISPLLCLGALPLSIISTVRYYRFRSIKTTIGMLSWMMNVLAYGYVAYDFYSFLHYFGSLRQ